MCIRDRVTGVPMLVFMATNFVKALGLNTIIMNQIGEDGMAVFTVCDNVLLIVEMLTGGIIGVIPNVAGILFGEKDYVGIRVLCKKMLKYSYIVLTVIFVLIMLFTEQITIMFGGEMCIRDRAKAYGISSACMDANEVAEKAADFLHGTEAPKLLEIRLEPGTFAYPKTCLGEPIHNQQPYIPKDVYDRLMDL